MPKDLKIGLAVGLGVVAVVGLWLATRPSLTPQAQLQRRHNTNTAKKIDGKPGPSVVSRNPAPKPASDTPNNDAPGNRNDPPHQTDERETLISQVPQGMPQGPKEAISPEQESPPEPVIPEQVEPIKTERFYIVQKNDTLSSISQKYYGTPAKWPKIFNANRTIIPDANRLAIGAKLIIPD
ncbi:MAG: LysM peptidoglycan-binding domain-containing protein [Sedimentisphaerales bacterium]|nr:LysM peptidoglycan-binding domain-containing protein [Sedimentisphaerales bacterium]